MESAQGKQVRCIVKMGGAAITHKDELESIDVEKLSMTCSQLRQSMVFSSSAPINMDWSRRDGVSHVPESFDLQGKTIHMDPFIIIHGAGSFGHFQASRSSVHKGGLETTLGKAGFVATRISVTRLNHEIVRALASEGIPAVGISPFAAGWSTGNRALEQSDVSSLRKILDAGLIPVLHGDAVFDSVQGCTILSGDVVLRKLAQDLKPTHAVFLTDVQGVFDRPPSDKDAVLLEEIVVQKDGSWKITRPESLSLKTASIARQSASDSKLHVPNWLQGRRPPSILQSVEGGNGHHERAGFHSTISRRATKKGFLEEKGDSSGHEGEKIYLNDDLTKAEVAHHKQLMPQVKAAQKGGKKALYRDGHVIVDGEVVA